MLRLTTTIKHVFDAQFFAPFWPSWGRGELARVSYSTKLGVRRETAQCPPTLHRLEDTNGKKPKRRTQKSRQTPSKIHAQY